MAASDDDRVELTELDVITRYSLAVRHASAPREELIAALRDDLAWLEGGRRRTAPKSTATAAARNQAKPTTKTTTKAATKVATKSAPKTAAKKAGTKTATRRSSR
jgi:hypothetical protein